MVKKQQTTDDKTTEQQVKPDKPIIDPQAKAIIGHLEGLAESIGNLNKTQEVLGQEIKANTRRINSLAKETIENPPPKQFDPLAVINAISGILNSPLVSTLIDKFAGGEPEAAPLAQNQVPPELAAFYNDFFKKSMNATLDNSLETIRAQKLKNDLAARELQSDY